jgi:hypothetical protein
MMCVPGHQHQGVATWELIRPSRNASAIALGTSASAKTNAALLLATIAFISCS